MVPPAAPYCQNRYRGPRLVELIQNPAVGMKQEVPGPGAGSRVEKRRVVGRERPVGVVIAIDQDLVKAAIGHQGKAIVGRKSGAVRMRALLPGLRTDSVVLSEAGDFPEPAIRLNGHQSQAAAAVVRRQQSFARLVQRDVSGALAATRDFVQKSQRSGLGINGVGAHRAEFARQIFPVVFVGGIQELSIGMHRQKRRAGSLGGQRDRRQFAARRLKPERVDTLSAVPRIGADVNEVLATGGAGDGCAEQEQEESG